MHLKARLNPVRRGSPRMRSLLRYATVASLLVLAAGTLFIDPAKPTGCPGMPDPTRTPSAAVAAGPDPHVVVPRDAVVPNGNPDTNEILSLPEGTVGVPIQLAEPGTASVLRPGNRVDVVARTGSLERPLRSDDTDMVLARDALVVAVTSPEDGVVYLAMTSRQARQVSWMAPGVALGITVTRLDRPG